jgi:hypothetical protein
MIYGSPEYRQEEQFAKCLQHFIEGVANPQNSTPLQAVDKKSIERFSCRLRLINASG